MEVQVPFPTDEAKITAAIEWLCHTPNPAHGRLGRVIQLLYIWRALGGAPPAAAKQLVPLDQKVQDALVAECLKIAVKQATSR